MKIINNTRKNVICNDSEVAKGFLKKTLGLMFRKEIDDDKCFLMEFGREGYHGIWMMFMRFPIDLVYLDSKKKVTGLFKKVKPVSFNVYTWRIYQPPKKAKWILELRSGKIKKNRIGIGDKISFV